MTGISTCATAPFSEAVLPETARHFARAIIMPNLVPPVVTAKDAEAYRNRILAALAGWDGISHHL